MSLTLPPLVQAAPESSDEDSVASWYLVNQTLGLPGLLHENKLNEVKQFSSVMEVLVDHMTLKTLNNTVEPAPWVRPSTTPNFQFPIAAQGNQRGQGNQRTGSAPSNTSPMQAKDMQERRPKSSGGVGGGYGQGTKTSLSSRLGAQANNAPPQPTIKRQLKALVFHDNGKVKASNQNWIPDEVRKQMVRRDMAVAKTNIETTSVRRKAAEAEKNRHKLNPLQTSKEKEKYGIERKTACGLCCSVFLPVNLVLAVPLKAVLDIRDSWGDSFDSNFAEKQLIPQVTVNASGGNTVKMVRVNPNLKKAPLCYDKVKVCTFCSQLFTKQQSVYRPSYEARAAVVRKKEEEEDLARRKAYWDPLTTTETERAQEMKTMKLKLERAEKGWDGVEEEGEEEVQEIGENLRLSRKSMIRTSSSGRIVRERVP